MKRKCSKHQNAEVVTYYPECKKFCCTECDKLMRELFPEYHPLPIEEASELTLTFEDRCKEIGHSDCPLNYFCKTHNELCCSECAYSGTGKHRGCAVVRARDMEMEFKARLSASVDSLSAEVERIEADMKRPDGVAATFADRVAQAEEAKQEVAEAVQEAFARYKEAVDKRKAALLADLEKRYKEHVNYAELGSEAAACLERARDLFAEQRKALAAWSPARLAEMIQDTLEVEREVTRLRERWARLQEDTALEPHIAFTPEKREFDDMVAKIASLGTLTVSLKKERAQKEVGNDKVDNNNNSNGFSAKEGRDEQTATNSETAGTKKKNDDSAVVVTTGRRGKGEEKRGQKELVGYRFRWVVSFMDITKCTIGGVGGTIATKVGDEDFVVLKGDTPIPIAQAGGASTVKWGVKVLKSLKNNGGLINVGVLPAGELPVTGKKLILKGWFFYCCPAQLFSADIKGKPYGPRRNKEAYVSSGTTVWVNMDMATGNLSFALNDEGPLDTVPAFEGIPLDKPLVPAVSLSHGEDSVEAVF